MRKPSWEVIFSQLFTRANQISKGASSYLMHHGQTFGQPKIPHGNLQRNDAIVPEDAINGRGKLGCSFS